MPKACVLRGSRHLYSESKLQNQPLVTRSAHSHAFDPLTKATVELIADFRYLDARLTILQQKYVRRGYPRRLHGFQIQRVANPFFPLLYSNTTWGTIREAQICDDRHLERRSNASYPFQH